VNGGGEVSMAEETCTGPDCLEPAERNVAGVGPLCPGHRKQHLRGKALSPLRPKSPRARLEQIVEGVLEAARHLADREAELEAELVARGRAYANADSENDAEWRARKRALVEVARALGVTEIRTKRRLSPPGLRIRAR
jgi:hypothetical protein